MADAGICPEAVVDIVRNEAFEPTCRQRGGVCCVWYGEIIDDRHSRPTGEFGDQKLCFLPEDIEEDELVKDVCAMYDQAARISEEDCDI